MKAKAFKAFGFVQYALYSHRLIKDFEGLDKNSIILLEQIRAIGKQRLREYLGALDRRFLDSADKALAISIGLRKKGLAPSLYGTSNSSYIENEGGVDY